jgi:hypothetical protein
MPLTLLTCAGGSLVLPDAALVLVDRADGGNLVVNPPRPAWDRSALEARELHAWSSLVAAAGAAMLAQLPQLDGGCLNYWDAGNWALNDDAPPAGRKSGPQHRQLHMHLLGRSPRATDPDFRWGEAPRFPDFEYRHAWAAPHARLQAGECLAITSATHRLLLERYGYDHRDIAPWQTCAGCDYPTAVVDVASLCPECSAPRGGA